MKKITLLTAFMLFFVYARAQMNIIEETTTHVSEHGVELAEMIYSSHEVLPKTFEGHLLATSLITYEFADNQHAVRVHGGVGYANKANTFAFGLKAGLKSYINSSSRLRDDIHLSTGFWMYLELKRTTCSIIFLDLRAYLVEGALLLNADDSKVQLSVLITNHGPNWGCGLKGYHQKTGIYGFVCITGKAYNLNQNVATGETEIHFSDPTKLPGALIALGIERKHRN